MERRHPIRGLTRRWSPSSASTPRESGRPLIDRVLAARGLEGPAASAFLSPSLRQLHDPSRLAGLDRAAARLLEAARAGEPLVIYGDYDVDGITATAILHRMLRAVAPGAAISIYIPHRLDEGYGLHEHAVRELAASGTRVIVSVDCGVTAVGPAAAAREAGVDLIITDHHNPPAAGEPLPEAYAVVHPRLGGAYPFAELCGAGVAYKLAWRLATLASGGERATPQLRELLVELLTLAALGTVADVVPLIDENRVITRFGLVRCASSPFAGLRALLEASGVDADVDARTAGFKLGPRLNACGRLGSALEAAELLITDDADRAAEIAASLTEQNDRRRETERRILEQALEMAEAAGMTGPDRRAVVLAHADWHAGVVGIVCSRLTEQLGRPAILLQKREDGSCVGSGRGIDGFNLHAGLKACAEYLTRFGGHDAAAGLSLESSRLPAFAEAFVTRANSVLGPEDLVRVERFDTDARVSELTPGAVDGLDRLAPFGRGNPPVRLRLRRARLAQPPRLFGRSSDHLDLRLEDAERGGPWVRLVGWRWAATAEPVMDRLRTGVEVEALIEPKLNCWNNTVRCEPELVDLRIATDVADGGAVGSPAVTSASA